MDKKLKFELRRKTFHLFGLSIILCYWLAEKYYNKQTALLALTFILIIFIVVEYFVIIKKKKILFLHTLRRPSESKKIAGTVYFALGAIIAFAAFDFIIALVVLLMLVFGDLSAALIGIAYGKHKIRKGSKIKG